MSLAKFSRLAVVALTVAAVAGPAATAAAHSPDPAGHGSVTTEERGCYEFNEIVLVPMASLRAAVPARYSVRAWDPEQTLGLLVFADYVCATFEVNGLGWPARSVTTIGLTLLSGRDGAPVDAYFVLWHGSNNPLLTRAFRRLGIESKLLPFNRDRVSPAGPGQSEVAMAFRGGQLDHRRDAVVIEPPETPVVEVTSAPFYAAGARGEVLLYYVNRIRPQSVGTVTVVVTPGTALARLGVPPSFSGQTGFLRGEWTSHAARTGG